MSLTYWVPVSSFGLTPSRLPAGEGEVSSGQGGGFNGDLGRGTVGPWIMGRGEKITALTARLTDFAGVHRS